MNDDYVYMGKIPPRIQGALRTYLKVQLLKAVCDGRRVKVAEDIEEGDWSAINMTSIEVVNVPWNEVNALFDLECRSRANQTN